MTQFSTILGDTISDLRYALRLSGRAKITTAVIVVTLALGIGANTVVFTLVDELLLRPLRVPRPGELVVLKTTASDGGVSYPDYLDYQRQSHTLAGLLAYAPAPVGLSVGESADVVSACFSSGNYFEVLETRPHWGRAFEVSKSANAPVAEVVISFALWQSRFGGDSTALGRRGLVNGVPVVVVGITPQGFDGPMRGFTPDLWIPMTLQPSMLGGSLESRSARQLLVLGRLKSGASVAEAQAEMAVIAGRLTKAYPDTNPDVRVTVRSEQGNILAENRALALFVRVLFCLVAFSLLIACTNVAHVLLARGVLRRKEMAVRLSLGAERSRLVRQLLAESLLLAVFGGLGGVLTALAVSRIAWSAILAQIRVPGLWIDTSVDARMLVFSGAVSVIGAFVAGVSPALITSAVDMHGTLKDQAGLARRVSGVRYDHLLIAGQVALSVALLVGTGLLIRTLERALRMDLGFPISGVSFASIDFKAAGYEPSKAVTLADELAQRIGTAAGVESVALARGPAAYYGWPQFLPRSPSQRERVNLVVAFVGPRYFETMRVPLRAGREFTPKDATGGPRVAILSEGGARRVWGETNVVGRLLDVWDDRVPYEIVGVVPDVRTSPVLPPFARVYFPLAQSPQPILTLHIRTSAPQAVVANLVQREMRGLSALLPKLHIQSLQDRMNDGYSALRLGVALLASMGAVSMLLAGIGIYGLTNQLVGARVREIGIRRALGADRVAIMKLVFSGALWPLVKGLGVGLVLALAESQFIATLVGGPRFDLLVMLAAPALLVGAGFGAAMIPAVRAAGVEPLEALRVD